MSSDPDKRSSASPLVRFFARLKLIRSSLVAGFSVLVLAVAATAGSLTPGASPAGTMHSLAELYDSIAGTFDSSAITASDSGSLIEHLKYIEANMATGSGVSSDSLDFDELVDLLTLDADTSIASGGFALSYIGDLGVGTTTPTANLHIFGDGSSDLLKLQESDSDRAYGFVVRDGDFFVRAPSASDDFSSRWNVLSVASRSLDLTVGTPASPSEVGFFNTSGTAQGVFISGKHAYVADGTAGLQIIDISIPSSPSLEGTLDTPGSALAVFVSGRYAYVADQVSGLNIVDVSNVSTPTSVGTLDPGSSANGIFVAGRYAYMTDGLDGLRVIDVADPSAPTLLATLDTTGSSIDVYVQGRYAYVADGSSGLQVIDVADPANPVIIGTEDTSGTAFGVYVSGRYAYVGDQGTGMITFDVSDPTDPVIVSTFDTPGLATDVYVSGRYAYVSDFGSGFRIVDVSIPSNPTLVSSFDTTGFPREVVLSGKYLYVVDDSSGLRIFSIGGLETHALAAGDISVGSVEVANDLDVANSLFVRNGAIVGNGGLLVNGDFGLTGDFLGNGSASISGMLEVTGVLYANGGCVGCGGSGVSSNSLDFDEFVDAMTLDADTSIASGGFVLDIGTTHLYADGELFLHRSGASNSFMGENAGADITTGFWNAVVGPGAGENLNTGAANVFLGYLAGNTATSSNNNVFIGANAGQSNTSGTMNVFIGRQAGVFNTTGSENTFVGGFNPGANNTTGNRNTFYGYYSGGANSTGGNNTFIGNLSGRFNSTGSNNAFLGFRSGIFNSTGEYNVAVGPWALNTNSAGSDNVALGASAGYSVLGSGNVFIGRSAGYSETGSNTLYIDNSTTANPLIYGQFDNNLLVFNAGVSVSGNFELTGSVSSHLVPRLNDTYDLGSSNYRWRDIYVASNSLHIGEAGDDAVIAYDPDSDYLAFKPDGSTTAVVIADGGNVGIGDTTPDNPLDIEVSTALSTGVYVTNSGSSGTAAVNLFNDVGANMAIGMHGTTKTSFGSIDANEAVVYADRPIIIGVALATGSIQFGVGSSPVERMRLTAAGNLGIGTLNSTPDEKLDVAGNILASTSGNVDLILNSTGDSDAFFRVRSVNSAGRLSVLSSASSELFSVLASGNVGVGTTTPAGRLTVQNAGQGFPATSGTTQSAGLITRLLDTSNATLDIGGNGTSGFWLQATHPLNLTLNYPLLLNPNGGNVGIASTSPGYRLAVEGSLFASSSYGSGLTDCDADGQTLSWDASTGLFGCGDDDTTAGGSGTTIEVEEFGGAFNSSAISSLSFDGGKFSLAASGSSDVGINLDWGAGGPASLSQNETVTGTWTFSTNPNFASGRLVASDALDFDEFVDSMTLDANLTVASGGFTVDWQPFFTSSLSPATDDVYSLGDSTHRWQSVYVGPNSLHIGDPGNDTTISFNTSTGTLNLDSRTVFSDGASFSGGAGLELAGNASFSYARISDGINVGNLNLPLTAYSRFGVATTTHGLSAPQHLLVSGFFEVDDRSYFDSTVSVSSNLEVTGYTSVSQLFGAGLTDCDGDTQTLSWDATTGRFGCGDDDTGGGGGSVSSDSLDFDEFVDAMILDADTSIASAGFSLTLQQASVSGALYARRFFPLTLTDCDNATASKLLWDSATGTFSCGSDQQGAGSAGGWTDGGTTVSLTAATDNVGIGTSAIDSSNKLEVSGAASVSGNFRVDPTSSTFLVDAAANNVGIGTTTTTARLTIVGEAGDNDILRISSASGDIMSINKQRGVMFGGSNLSVTDAFVQINTNAANNPTRSEISTFDDLFVDGDTEIDGILDVGGAASFSDALEVGGGGISTANIIKVAQNNTNAAIPNYTWSNDSDTGFSTDFQAANKLFFITGGTVRGFFDGDGDLRLGGTIAYNTTAASTLEVVGADAEPIGVFYSSQSAEALYIAENRALHIGTTTISATRPAHSIDLDTLNGWAGRSEINALNDLYIAGALEIDNILDVGSNASISGDVELAGGRFIAEGVMGSTVITTPVFTFDDDQDTGISHEGSNAPNKIFFMTAGAGAGLFDGDGDLRLGGTIAYSTAPASTLEVVGADAEPIAAFFSSQSARALSINENRGLCIGGCSSTVDAFQQVNTDATNENPTRSEIASLDDLFISGDLEVDGILDIANDASFSADIEMSTTGTQLILPDYFTGANLDIPVLVFNNDRDTGLAHEGTNAANKLYFVTAGNAAGLFDASGNFVLDSTAAFGTVGSAKLDVTGTSGATEIARFASSSGARALIIGPNQALTIGGAAYNAADDFNQINNDATNNNPGRSEIGAITDLFISGDLEVNGILDIGSAATFANGTAAAPSLNFTGSTTTGLFRAGTDILGVTTAGAEAMRVDASGNVGIGTTTTSGARLSVTGPSGNNQLVRISSSSGTEVFTITKAGNVGIGDTAPGAKLSFGALTGTPQIHLYDAGAGGSSGFGIQSNEVQFFTPTTAHFSFNAGGDLQTSGTNEVFRIEGNGDAYMNQGNLGIGTSGAAAQLVEMFSSANNGARLRITGTSTTGGGYSGVEFYGSGGTATTFGGGIFREQSNDSIAIYTRSGTATPKVVISNGTSSYSSLAVTGSISQSPALKAGTENYMQTNGAATFSTSTLAPGILFYQDANQRFGADLGYTSGTARYNTRIFAPSGADIVFARHTTGALPTAQSSFTNAVTIRGDSGNVGIAVIAPEKLFEVGGDIFASASGNVFIGTGYLQAGGTTAVTYNRFGTATTGHSLSGQDDVLVSGDLETNGVLYADGGITMGAALNLNGNNITNGGTFSGTTISGTSISGSSLGISGSASISGNLEIAGITKESAGSAAAPSYTFTGQTNTGVYHSGTTLGLSAGGTAVTITSAGLLNAPGGFSDNGSAGQDSDCAPNEFLGNMTVSGGIVTAGSCETDDIADYAERFFAGESGIEAGDIIVADPTGELGIPGATYDQAVRKSTKAYQDTTLGVVSTKPGLVLGSKGTDEHPAVEVAVAGRVPVKVVGAVKVGDRIAASGIPGVGMVATQAGMTVGIALEPTDYAASGSTQTVIAFISPGYWAPSVEAATEGSEVLAGIGDQWLGWDFSELFSSVVDAFSSVLGIVFEPEGRIKAKELCLDDVCVTKEQLQELLQGQSGAGSAPADDPAELDAQDPDSPDASDDESGGGSEAPPAEGGEDAAAASDESGAVQGEDGADDPGSEPGGDAPASEQAPTE